MTPPGPTEALGGLRVLLTIQTMEGPAGGSLYVRDFAVELFRQGHLPAVYCRRLGAVSDQLLQRGIPVVDAVTKFPRPDIIHGNSPIETAAAVLRFADVPAIFVSHGWGSPDALPPRLPSIVRYLAVSEHARDALMYFHGIPAESIDIHLNPVDLALFERRASLPPRPVRGLVLSNSLTEANHLGVLQDACREAGVTIDVVGLGMGSARLDPQRLLVGYDLVFAKGRSALEALAVGASVMLCDAAGFGELITSENYDVLRSRNFGLRTFHHPPIVKHVLTQLERYDPADASAVTDRVRASEGLVLATARLVDIYRSSISQFGNAPLAGWDTERMAVARFLDSIAPTANTFYLAEQVDPVERRARRAEARVRRIGETLHLDAAIGVDERSRLAARVVAAPRDVEPNELFEVRVRITNGSSTLLTSFGKHPIHLSYHWLGEDGRVLEFEGMRSEVFPPLPPGQAFEYPMRVRSLAADGDFVLRVTLVQEFVAWFDEAGLVSDARVRCF